MNSYSRRCTNENIDVTFILFYVGVVIRLIFRPLQLSID